MKTYIEMMFPTRYFMALLSAPLVIILTMGTILMSKPAQAATDIQVVTSPGGITAWLVENHDIPFVALDVDFRGGTSLDMPQKRGAVKLMANLLSEGAGELDSQAFARARESLAMNLSLNADRDSVSVSAQFLTANRSQAIGLLRQMFVEPRFDPQAIERIRGQTLSVIKSNLKNPSVIADAAFWKMAYGDHPYATSGNGSEETLSALTRDDIVQAYKNSLAQDRIYVAAVGDITPEQLKKILDDLFGDLPQKGSPLPPKAELLLTGGVTVSPFPGPQSVVSFAQKGILQDDPDFFAANVLLEALGGGRFGSILMTEVREKRGLTYGIRSSLANFDEAELVLGRFSSANATVGQAMDIVREQWKRVAKEGLSQEALDKTKIYMTGSYPLRFDGNARIASMLVGMQLAGFSADYPQTRNDKINAVTLEDVKRVAHRLLSEKDLRFVVVGMPDGVSSTD